MMIITLLLTIFFLSIYIVFGVIAFYYFICSPPLTLPSSDPEPEACDEQLKKIPVLIYHKPSPTSTITIAIVTDADAHADADGGGDDDGDESESCVICMSEYEEGENVRKMSECGHMFHKDCIDEWLITRSSFCPVCRDRVIQRNQEPHMHIQPHDDSLA